MDVSMVFDIGGTSFRTGIFNSDLELLEHSKVDSNNYLDGVSNVASLQEGFLNLIADVKDSYARKGYKIKKIGLGFPGPVNKKGEVLSAPTLWGPMKEIYPLNEKLSEMFRDTKVFTINDLTAAGWRYIKVNNGTFCVVTISSGVGNKVFWKGEVLISDDGYGGELGHAFYGSEYSAYECGCGMNGHIGGVSSGRGIEKIAEQYFINNNQSTGQKFTTYDLIRGLNSGDPQCVEILTLSTLPIAKSIQFIFSVIGIDRFIIIGGVPCSIGQLYIDSLLSHMKNIGFMGKSNDQLSEMLILGNYDDLNGIYGMANYLNSIS
ncbi:ROK family protein [Paenibacillus sp. GSMTC-2017]|uniref:ROK family protein n=1 Tax=Paenibacillus sp. GSMTC-2017 TaxID=2794350 RepID=UPI0018D8D1DF|nr:ROK family protein [Paenibacillus sp. GSMTC-2017]MBH5320319.1 ROK family protein [Paenibacillus sp. GSMTC-2017]